MSPSKQTVGHKNTDDKKKPINEEKEHKREERGHVTYDHDRGSYIRQDSEKTEKDKERKR